MQPRTRRVQRIHFPQPLTGRLGRTDVAIVDLSVLGARVEHGVPLGAAEHSRIVFEWDGELIAADCRVVRSRVEKGGVHRSGIEFDNLPGSLRETIRRLIAVHLQRAFDEQRRAARDLILPPLDALTFDNGYVCLSFDSAGWLRKRTHDPGQPADGFTVSADETDSQIELLREAYERSDTAGRRLIQLFAQLSLAAGEGNREEVGCVVGVAQ